MSYLSLTPEDKKLLNDLKKKKSSMGYDNLSKEEKLFFTKLRTIEKGLSSQVSFLAEKEKEKKGEREIEIVKEKEIEQNKRDRSQWIEDNKILIMILFWGAIALMVWSPWINKTSNVKENGVGVPVHCKNVDSISAGEIYENAKSTGLDISYEDAQNMAREVNDMPRCD